MFFHLNVFYVMYAKVLIASVVGMAIVSRIKNEYLRASIGIPIVALMMFMLLSLSVSAQWRPDRPDYTVVSDGNFYINTNDMATAISTSMSTLNYNGAKLNSINVDKGNIDAPLFSHFHRNNYFVYIAYVARTKTGYVVWFKYLPEKRYEFEEEYVVLEYEGMD